MAAIQRRLTILALVGALLVLVIDGRAAVRGEGPERPPGRPPLISLD